MSKIGFLTDSCSDIPQELADKYGIEVVGFPINLDGVEYMERKDFTNDLRCLAFAGHQTAELGA